MRSKVNCMMTISWLKSWLKSIWSLARILEKGKDSVASALGVEVVTGSLEAARVHLNSANIQNTMTLWWLMSLILEHGQSSLLTTVLDTAACALVVQAAKRHNDDEHVQKNVCWLLSVLADRGGT